MELLELAKVPPDILFLIVFVALDANTNTQPSWVSFEEYIILIVNIAPV